MAARDVVLITVILFSLGIAFFVTSFAVDNTISLIVANPEVNSSAAAVQAFNDTSKVTGKLDYVIFGVFMGLVLALIVTSYLVGGHPLFMFFYFIVIIVLVSMSAVMSNVWETTTTMPVFGATISHYPITNNLMTYLPMYSSVVGFIGLVVMFAKPYVGGEI